MAEKPHQPESMAFEENTKETAFLYVKDKSKYTAEPWASFKNKSSQGSHDLIYHVNGEEYKSVPYYAGSKVTKEGRPEGEGYNGREFSGWKGEPDIMPDQETIVVGNFQYKITYKDKDDNVIDENVFFFGDKVTVSDKLNRDAENKKYTLTGLKENPISEDDVADLIMTMPAEDLVVDVTYKSIERTENGITYKFVKIKGEKHAEVISGTDNTIISPVTFENEEYPVTVIQARAFQNKALDKITIPSSVTVIGDYAFQGCSSLKEVKFMSNDLDSIGQQAFANTVITEVTVPNANKMGREIFKWCTQLKEISFSENVTVLPNRIFQNCKGLTVIDIPNQITEIGIYAFDGCESLQDVSLSNNLTTIGESAFNGCYKITNLTLPASVTTIGNYAFYNVFGEEDIIELKGNSLPNAMKNTFDDAAYENAVLKTTVSVKGHKVWGDFYNPQVEGIISELPECAQPTITIKDNKLNITYNDDKNATDGITIVTTISVEDDKEIKETLANGKTVVTIPLTKIYKVKASAQKSGMKKAFSEYEYKTQFDANGDGKLTPQDASVTIQEYVKNE